PRLDLGHSFASGEPVGHLLLRTAVVSILLLLPGFVVGIVLALLLALVAAWRPGSILDRFCALLAAAGMSLSLVIIVIGMQAVFGVWLDWFPVRGWRVHGPLSYLHHVTVPSLSLIAASLGYNLRFFHAIFRQTLTEAP